MAAVVDTNLAVYVYDRGSPERRARAVALFDSPPDRLVVSTQVLPARVAEVDPDGPAQLLVGLDVAGERLLARITRRSGAALGIGPGVALALRPVAEGRGFE